MKSILIVVVVLNFHHMEVISESYPSMEECLVQKPLVRESVKSINEHLYPLQLISVSCVPEKKDEPT